MYTYIYIYIYMYYPTEPSLVLVARRLPVRIAARVAGELIVRDLATSMIS